ncbi:Hypothetical protein, putative, partial [Bodo saltans]
SGTVSPLHAAHRCSSSTSSKGQPSFTGGGLSLGLDFSNMNFAAMAKNTKAALRNEEDFRKDVMLGGVVAELDSLTQSMTAPKTAAAFSSVDHSSSASPAQKRHIDTSSWASSLSEEDGRRPSSTRTSSNNSSGQHHHHSTAAKRTLKERLQDCVVSGNWTKAMQMFSKAVQESNASLASSVSRRSSSTLTTGGVSGGAAAPTTNNSSDASAVVSSIPTATVIAEGQGDANSFYHKDHLGTGLTRWNGNHIQTVIRCVVNAEVPEALRQVWQVVVTHGVMKNRFDAHNLNGIIGSMARRGGQQTTSAVAGQQHSAVKPAMDKKDWQDFVLEWRQLRKQIIIDVAEFAAASKLELNEASVRTYHRILEDTKRREVATSASASLPSSDGALPVANIQDFNRMLEQLVKQEDVGESSAASSSNPVQGTAEATSSTPHWTVDTLLAASTAAAHDSSVPVRWNERTYSILLHRLLQRQHRAVASSASPMPAITSEGGVSPGDRDASAAPPPAPLQGKTLWEQSPMLAEAEPIFAQYLQTVGPHRYPAPFLVADMLEFVKHRRALDHRVYQFVALLLHPDARSHFVEQMTTNNDAMASTTSVSQQQLQHPLQWGGSTPNHLPSPKIFEILIRHALHMGRAEECHFWYDEMRQLGCRGTGVVYHTMIELAAKKKSPNNNDTSHRSGGGDKEGRRRDGQQDILDVYGQMKEVGLDVTNVSTTVSLINAWSNKHQASLRRRSR